MYLDELSAPSWRPTNPGGNYTNNGYPTRTPTTTPPPANAAAGNGLQATGDGVIEFSGPDGGLASRGLILVPYGVDASTHTFSFKVLGWRPTAFGTGAPALWVPTLLLTCQVTLGTAAGVAGSDLGTTQQFGTTIAVTTGPSFNNAAAPNTVPPILPDEFVVSPGNNDIASVYVRSLGFRYLEVIYTTGGVVTSCNALWCKF